MKFQNPTVLLIPVMATLLVTAQAIWTTGVRRYSLLQGSPRQIAMNLLTSPHMWIGGLIYVVATVVYLMLLSKLRFFSVQISMTAIGIVLSTLLSVVLFKEQLSYLNLLGAALVLLGVPFVLTR
jgi:hypothetical protein